MHDFHRNTAEALPELLRQLKVSGYKVVHLVPKEQLTTVPKYDEMFNHRETVSSNAQPGPCCGTGNSYGNAPEKKHVYVCASTGP